MSKGTVDSVVVAGRRVDDPLKILTTYIGLRKLERTLMEFDLADRGAPDRISIEEAGRRTRRIASRVSELDAEWFASRSMTAAVRAAFAAVTPESELRAADPLVEDGLYDHANALFDAFRSSPRPGVAGGKIHKVLQVKRPRLIPILDQKLRKIYAAPARVWRKRILDQRGIDGHGYWAAIRDDLLAPVNTDALLSCRAFLVNGTSFQQRVATLSDLRLLDMVAWSLDK